MAATRVAGSENAEAVSLANCARRFLALFFLPAGDHQAAYFIERAQAFRDNAVDAQYIIDAAVARQQRGFGFVIGFESGIEEFIEIGEVFGLAAVGSEAMMVDRAQAM